MHIFSVFVVLSNNLSLVGEMSTINFEEGKSSDDPRDFHAIDSVNYELWVWNYRINVYVHDRQASDIHVSAYLSFTPALTQFRENY